MSLPSRIRTINILAVPLDLHGDLAVVDEQANFKSADCHKVRRAMQKCYSFLTTNHRVICCFHGPLFSLSQTHLSLTHTHTSSLSLCAESI